MARKTTSKTTCTGIGARDFSASINQRLAAMGYRIVRVTSIPAHPGDIYYTGTGYELLDKDDQSFIRDHYEVGQLANYGRCKPIWDMTLVEVAAI